MRAVSETLKVVFLTILAYTIFLPCAIIFAIGLLFWRSCVKALVYFRYCGQGWRIVHPGSVGMGSTDVYGKHSWTVATTFEIHQETFNLQKLRTDFEKTILSAKICETNPSSKLAYPELTSCLEERLGYYFWRPCPTFKIEDHFSYLDAPVLKSVDDPEDLNTLTNHLLRERLWKKGQPLWEWIIVEKLDGKCLVIFRIHHIIADGWSLFKLAARMFTTENNVPLASSIPIPSGGRGSCLISPNFILAPYQMVKLKRELNSSTTLIPEEVPLSKNSPENLCFAAVQGMALNEMKAIRSKLGVDFLSLLLAGVAGAIREGFINKGLPVPDSIKVACPIPLPGHPNKLCNYCSMCFVLLPIGEPDPVRRLHLISKRVVTFLHSSLPVTFRVLALINGSIPLPLLRSADRRIAKLFPVVLNNMVGPPARCFLIGSEIQNMKFGLNIPFTASTGFAYGVGFFTYNGESTLGVAGLGEYFPSTNSGVAVLNSCINEYKLLSELSTDFSVVDVE